MSQSGLQPTIERRRVRLGGAWLAYEVAGAGPPVVLVHGLSGSTRWWARTIGPLAERLRVHAVDLVGFGRSRGRQRFVLGEAASCLVAWMDLLAIDRASFVGHSMGGFVAASLAADFPDRVDRLVLVDAAALPFDRRFRQPARGLGATVRRVPLGFLPILVTDAARAGPRTIGRAARELLAADLRPKLVQIRAPTLVVWGEDDRLVPVGVGRRLAEAVPTATLATIPGAGHNPMWDRPGAFNRLTIDFLTGDPETIDHS